MTTAYQHRPLSKILAQPAGPKDEGKPEQARDPDTGKFVAAPDPTEDTLPEKYRGKSKDEIVKMHQNSEQRLGQIQNEVGQLRGMVRDLSQLQRTPTPATEAPQDVDLTGDELLNDPVSAIKKVVQATQPKTPAEDPALELDAVDAQLESNALLSDFPDMETTVSSEEFQQFIARTPSRQQAATLAADPTAGVAGVQAARRLLEDYQDFQAQSAPSEDPNDPVAKARAVANEPGHEAAVVPQNVIYEADVIALINSDPEKYRSPSFQAELTKAIREKRFIKQS